ncbi:Hpt domain-containing protein, partial [Desulfosarcina sp.]|uniref:Hpt domain-containing protein n=1 Tax=Desulfosarcina sp. TaxID=2027861 RepID=UPI00397080DA
MTIQDDETLQMYLEESIEHLADIETDLLAIEEAGADINEDLVNKVYRAAHSIKGGAGFMGLTTIKDLTHEMENILGKIRSRDMTPTPEIVNVLLMASDTLKSLMNDVFTSNEVDIAQHIVALQAIAQGKALPAAVAPELSPPACPDPEVDAQADPPGHAETQNDPEMVLIAAADNRTHIRADRCVVEGLIDEGKYVYLARIDLVADVIEKGKHSNALIEEMEQTGTLIACSTPPDKVRSIELKKGQSAPPFIVLFATILKPEDINVLFEIPGHQIHQVMPDMTTRCLGTESSQPAAEDDAPEPVIAARPEPVPAVEAKPAAALAPGEIPPPMQQAATGKKTETETSLRVHVSLLDQLMTLAGELVLSRNQLLQSMSSEDH